MPLRIIGPSRVLNLYVYDASGCFFFGPQNDAIFEVSRYLGVVSILFHKTWILRLESQAAPANVEAFFSLPDPGTPGKPRNPEQVESMPMSKVHSKRRVSDAAQTFLYRTAMSLAKTNHVVMHAIYEQ